MSLDITSPSVWTVMVPPGEGTFRFYNKTSSCWLATSFRSFPDYDDWTSNTISREVRLELEANCNTNATLKASTFHAIDDQ